MGLFGFGNKKEGGILDVIRCDEDNYLMWKWSPNGEPSRKENAIRYGSSLRVQAGQVAVFVYKQKDGSMMDYIVGPYDQTIKTANFPVLSSIVGAAFGGASPFQAEIYFINLAGSVSLKYFLDWFKVSDTRFPDLVVPVQVKGSITFCITDYKRFISKYRMRNYEMDELEMQIRDMAARYVKKSVTNAPSSFGIPVLQIERAIDPICSSVENLIRPALEEDFGVTMKRFDISDISFDESSDSYAQLMELGASQTATMQTQYSVNMQNMVDMQSIGAENMAESLRIQREETQRRQKLDTETAYLGAHQLNIQGDVAKTAAESLGMMNANVGFGDGGGMNPAGMMTGMMMGGAVGGGMANMMGNMMQGMNQAQPPAPPTGAIAQYHVVINGQQSGPYNMAQLQQLVQNGQLAPNTYVWKQGMSGWDFASNVPELRSLFGAVPPPPPPVM